MPQSTDGAGGRSPGVRTTSPVPGGHDQADGRAATVRAGRQHLERALGELGAFAHAGQAEAGGPVGSKPWPSSLISATTVPSFSTTVTEARVAVEWRRMLVRASCTTR